MVAIKGRKSSNKNPPIFSHEFVIQNHGDIVSCVALIFVTGLMVQATSPWAYTFIALHHNVSSDIEDPMVPVKYTTGWKDSCAVFFYFLITIVMHAVFQEYVFDKISKRLHLSKVKLAKFNESSQLVLFFALSIIWGIDIIVRENLLLNITSLWKEYPVPLTFSLKLFFIGQLSYWLHCYPELYFQRVKREDIPPRIVQATIGFLFTLAAYILNFQQVGIMLLVLHYAGDIILHVARIVHFVSKREQITKLMFLVANSMYLFVRIATLAVATLVFLYGLSRTESVFDYVTGNFNVPLVRFSALSIIIAFQAYLSYVYVTRQIKRVRDNAIPVQIPAKTKQKSKKKEGKKPAASEDDDLPEVDQATKKNLRSRSSAKAK
ncbi:PREDICTED: translocating chain-associated membrane protein 1 [Dufourea novaeangliae]|uniref:Translocating chain-associated membrane protein 1-like 1 n=1 Tax=Dufourea novaeangliae TaxID=178035 RepID=A0A154NZU2_DUFNO|nr:PREDICTED: translocating chain-associated membrane protein 1 [Dufourea novaeangliae]KZC05102.1 Translocating chain-associated membrane protein 1-like 1 [Dufourea novaeangliae]